jgi:flagellar motor switch protein FliG
MQLRAFDPSEPALPDPSPSREESVAALLTTLPVEIAERVLTKLGATRGGRLRGRMRDFAASPPPPGAVEDLMGELRQRLISKPAPRVVQVVAAKALPAPAAAAAVEISAPPVAEKSVEPAAAPDEPEPTNDRDVLARLRRWDHGELAGALGGEPPGVVAVVMNCLDAAGAGKVLKLLPAAAAKEAFISLIVCNPNDRIAVQIVRTVLRKCKAGRERAADKIGPQTGKERHKQLAGLLRAQQAEARAELLQALEHLDGEAAAAVKDQLYTFEDLLLLDDRSVQKVLRRVSTDALTFALIGAAEEITDVVQRNLSKRAGEALQEELESRTSAPPAKVEEGQHEVVQAILLADAAGELTWKS